MMLLLAAALALANPSDTAELRFAPALGRQMVRDFDLEMRVQVDSAGTTRSRETAARGSVRQVAGRGYRGELVMHLGLESLAVREREHDEPWSADAVVSSGEAIWRQAALDERMRQTRVRDGGGTTGARLLEWVALGLPGFTLPSHRVRTGDAWRTWVRLPRSVPRLPDGPWLDMAVRVAVRLDSVKTLVGDERYFLSFRADGVDRAEQTDVSPDGVGVAGVMVWSRAWSAFVAQAVRVVVSSEGRDPAGVFVRARLETVLRSHLRAGP